MANATEIAVIEAKENTEYKTRVEILELAEQCQDFDEFKRELQKLILKRNRRP